MYCPGLATGRLAVLPACLLFTLSACDTSSKPSADKEGVAQTGQSSPQNRPSSSATKGLIPVALHGRWALKPEDCSPAGGMATGALTVTDKDMRFYETVAEPTTITEQTPSLIRAQFAFSGEGVSWDREQSLELTGSNDTLVRREYGIDAPTEPFTYTKCPNGE